MWSLWLLSIAHAVNHAQAVVLPLIYLKITDDFNVGVDTIAFLSAGGAFAEQARSLVAQGAGILDLETHGGPQRFMQHAACQVTIDGVTETVVGFENHSGLTELGPDCEPFGRVLAGAGNNGKDGLEGARSRNVFATYLHGPCLPKNPWLTDLLIRMAVGRAEGVWPASVVLAPLNDELEKRAHDMALEKAMANRGRRTALEPAKLVRGRAEGA